MSHQDCIRAMAGCLPGDFKLCGSEGAHCWVSFPFQPHSTPINLFNTAFGLLGLRTEAQALAKKAAGGPSAQEGLLPICTTAPLTLGNS